jgi:predicted nicotinamide N-methyase
LHLLAALLAGEQIVIRSVAMASSGIGFESFSRAEEDVFLSLFGRGSDSEDEEGLDSQQRIAVCDSPTNDVSSQTTFSSTVAQSCSAIANDVKIIMVERKQLGIAHQLWPAAKFLCDYLHKNPEVLVEAADKAQSVPALSVIELGAGIGLCGMFVAQVLRHSHKVTSVLTDLPEALDGLNENIACNGLEGEVRARVLSWGVKDELDAVLTELSGPPPLVIAADCVYWECLFEPLFTTIQDLVAVGCKVIIAHVRRWKKDGKFFAMCRKAGLAVTTLVEVVEVVPAEHTGAPTRQVTRIYCIEGGPQR